MIEIGALWHAVANYLEDKDVGTVTVRTPIKGWNFKPDEGETPGGRGHLVRAKDDVSIPACVNRCLWEKQILDFEFTEGTQWTGDQIKAMVGASGGGSGDRMMCISYVASPADLGGNPPTPEITGMDFASGPDEGTVVVTSGTLHMPTYYDIGWDERREITQEIVDNMERSIQRLIAERKEIRSDKAPDALLVADRNARVRERDDALRERDQARSDADHWSNECARAVRLHEERGRALLRILGDMPSPMEDPYERCRGIASAALGYQAPEPMKLPTDGFMAGVKRHADFHTMRIERDALAQSCAAATVACEERDIEIALLRQALAAKDARIAQLDTRFAFTPVAFEDLDAKPEPEHNPFRQFPRDMRRMGP